MKKVDKREGFIDLFRGIGIILMVIGHMKFQYKPNGTGIAVFNEYSHYIHVFHMPMFFFLSGFCYQKSKGTIVDEVKKGETAINPILLFWHKRVLPLEDIYWG